MSRKIELCINILITLCTKTIKMPKTYPLLTGVLHLLLDAPPEIWWHHRPEIPKRNHSTLQLNRWVQLFQNPSIIYASLKAWNYKRLKERGSELANLLHLHVTKYCEFPELQIPIFHTNTSKSSWMFFKVFSPQRTDHKKRDTSQYPHYIVADLPKVNCVYDLQCLNTGPWIAV
jgi:hypothetical protein